MTSQKCLDFFFIPLYIRLNNLDVMTIQSLFLPKKNGLLKTESMLNNIKADYMGKKIASRVTQLSVISYGG